MRSQSEILNRARPVFWNFRRTNMFGATTRARIQKGILVREIVKTALWNDFQNRQRLLTENADGQLAAWNKLLDQEFTIVFASIRNRRINFPLILNDMHPDRRALPGRFDDERNGNRRALANRHDLPVRRGDIVLAKRLLGANLVEGQLTFRRAFTCVRDAAVFQDSLHLAIFTKGSVQRGEGEVDAVRQFEVR